MTDPYEALELVRRDVELGIGQFLTANRDDGTHGFRLLEAFREDADAGIRNETTGTVAVPWAFRGTHELSPDSGRTHDAMGFLPTGRVVDVKGVTLVHVQEGELRFTRFVDWISAMADIGVGLYKRPVLDDPAGAGMR